MKRRKVLVIDDEESVLLFFKRLGKHEDFEVIGIGNKLEIAKNVQEGTFDLVFLDVAMPNISAIEVLKNIKSINPSLTVYLMTGSEIDQVERHAVTMGAAGCLYKPFDFSGLVEIITNAKTKCSQ